MKLTLQHYLVLLLLPLCCLVQACSDPTEGRSPLFCQLFYADSVPPSEVADTFTFRHNLLGQALSLAKTHEHKGPPRHEDEFGLAYELDLGEDATLLLDYYSGREKLPNGEDRLISIVADVLLRDEVESARLYAEIEKYLNQRYGFADGSFNQQIWHSYTPFTNNMEVRLVLNENKRQIRLNFIDLQTSQPVLVPEPPANPVDG